MNKKIEIKVIIESNGQEIIQTSAYSFESIYEELGKLERYCKSHTFCSKCGEIVSGDIGFEEGDSLCGNCAS